MFYNRITRVWVIDPLDYFLLSAFLGSILASRLKDYLSERKAMERLKNSIIEKSKSAIKSDRTIPDSKEIRMKKVYKFALENRGGQFENFQTDPEFSSEVYNLAREVKELVERLARFLKERELKGVAKIFFKNGRLLLELLLYKCNINISYLLLTEGVSTQVIVITVTAGGAAGFAISWFSVGASLVIPPLLITALSLRSVSQQIINHRNYQKFKKLVKKMLEDDEIRETVRAFLVDEVFPSASDIRMKPWGSDKNPLPEFQFDSDQTLQEFIKERMEEELGFIENPTPDQIKEIIQNRKIKPKGKTVYFNDFVKQIAEESDDIIEAEIVEKAIQVRVRNEEL